MKVINDYIAVRLDEFADKSAGGILLPQLSQEKPVWVATVLVVGKGLPTISGDVVPLTVITGDRIMYHRSKGYEIEVEGKKVTILKEADVLVIL